jgi:hypothetical protein
MRGAIPVLLPSKPYITSITADGLFCRATYCTLVSFSANFDPEDGGNTFLRNIGSHTDYDGAISQKMATFITTAVRTSNPTKR